VPPSSVDALTVYGIAVVVELLTVINCVSGGPPTVPVSDKVEDPTLSMAGGAVIVTATISTSPSLLLVSSISTAAVYVLPGAMALLAFMEMGIVVNPPAVTFPGLFTVSQPWLPSRYCTGFVVKLKLVAPAIVSVPRIVTEPGLCPFAGAEIVRGFELESK
jgi:hypothetical protein